MHLWFLGSRVVLLNHVGQYFVLFVVCDCVSFVFVVADCHDVCVMPAFRLCWYRCFACCLLCFVCLLLLTGDCY